MSRSIGADDITRQALTAAAAWPSFSVVHFQAAATLLQRGLTPQDYDSLSEEFDLLAVADHTLHDPESAGEDPAHLEQILAGGVIWVPGAVPYEKLWRDLKVGVPPEAVKLCPSCFPPKG